jgi:hypothetical protein
VSSDADFNAQTAPNPIVETFRCVRAIRAIPAKSPLTNAFPLRKQVELMPPAGSFNPLQNINLIRPIRIWLNGRKLDRLIGQELDERFNKSQANGDAQPASKPATGSRSVVTLALNTYQKEFQSSAGKASPSKTTMDPTFRATAIDQIKTFIFAGHDTTSSTIAYAFYLLHSNSRCHARMAAELDAVLGPVATAPATLTASPHLINNLPYTTAVFKEVLRIFPPASTLRWGGPPSSGLTFTDPRTGTTYPLAGCEIWPVSHAIHRNETYFPRPLDFVPERFMPADSPEFGEFVDSLPGRTPPAVHKDSWRPFEKGPRNCIGQELAMLETKVILALSVREFDFRVKFPEVVLEDDHKDGGKTTLSDGSDGGERCESANEKWPRWCVEGHRCIQVLKGSAKPIDGMPGVVLVR